MQQTWYYKEGSKKAELWTILHIPYTFMCISFLIVGFAISKPVNITALLLISAAYFLGLGIAAHAFDQLPGQGSSYVQCLKPKELLAMGVVCFMLAWGLGVYFIIAWQARHMIWLMLLQGFFAVAYPAPKLIKTNIFHNDFSFAVGFGFMPVVVGFYANTLTLSPIILPFSFLCGLIALIEITLSRYVRIQRKEIENNIDITANVSSDKWVPTNEIQLQEYITKPERALKLLCLLSYALAAAIFLW